MRTCEPCAPNFLQPLAGQVECLPCPRDGVDCTVQDRVQVLPGWFLDADETQLPGQHSGGGGASTYTIELTVAGDIDGFNSTAFDASLREFLLCRAPECDIALTLAAASVSVSVAVNDTLGTTVGAAASLETMSEAELTRALGVAVEGDVVVDGATTFVLDAAGISPTLCPQRSQCLGGGGNNDTCAGATRARCAASAPRASTAAAATAASATATPRRRSPCTPAARRSRTSSRCCT